VRQDCFDEIEHAEHVHLKSANPAIRVVFGQRSNRSLGPGVIHEHIDLSKRAEHLIRQSKYIVPMRNISGYCQALPSKPPYLSGRFLQLRNGTRGDCEPGAFASEGQSHGSADSASGAGDEGDFAF
jgi:hypothetical protein